MILLRVLGAGGFAATILLVNGGYVYRTKCPLLSGGTQTSWTYGINDVIPYTRSTSPPCKSHTGTRLVLSAVGIWPLHDSVSASSTQVTGQDRAAANALAKATAAISAEYVRERKLGNALKHDVTAHGGFTAALRRRAFSLIETGIAHLLTTKTALDASARAKDAELAETQRVLSLWLAREIEVDRTFLTSSTSAEQIAIARKIVPLAHRLQQLAPDIQAKYPNVKDWSFLPNA